MAWIQEVTFSGLAGNRRKRRIKLNRDLNIFWGVNGCGKTSLLKILHSAMSNQPYELSRVEVSEAAVSIIAEDGSVEAVLHRRAAREGPRQQEEALFRYEQSVGVDDDIDTGVVLAKGLAPYRQAWSYKFESRDVSHRPAFAHRYLPVSRMPGPLTAETRYRLARGDRTDRVSESDFFDQLFADSIQEVWRDYATQELVEIRRIQQRGLADILSAVIGTGTKKYIHREREIGAEQASTAVRRFFQAQEIHLPSKALERLVSEYAQDSLLRNVVAEIVEVQEKVDAAQSPTRKIEDLIAQMFSGGKQVFLAPRRLSVTVGKEEKLPVASLSSGEKQLLRLFVECRAAGDSAILVDEPELSMHVDWQHTLLESMQTINPDAQIIVATHSPEIMARVSDDKIFEL